MKNTGQMDPTSQIEHTEQIQKIIRMERYLDEGSCAVREFAEALEKFIEVQPKIKELSAYYGSPEWFRDLEDYDNGKLPKDLKCGVLSEDLVYNLLMENSELLRRLSEVVK